MDFLNILHNTHKIIVIQHQQLINYPLKRCSSHYAQTINYIYFNYPLFNGRIIQYG